MKDYLVAYQSDDKNGLLTTKANNEAEAKENILSVLSPETKWELKIEENIMPAVVKKVSEKFKQIQEEQLGIALFFIKAMKNAEFLPTYEIAIIDNPFISQYTACFSDKGRECIEKLFEEFEVSINWNNLGDIFWQKLNYEPNGNMVQFIQTNK